MKNPLTPAGIEPATFRFVAQHFNHWTTAVPRQETWEVNFGAVSYNTKVWIKACGMQKSAVMCVNITTYAYYQSFIYSPSDALVSCLKTILKFILTLILLTWRIWWAPNNASRWQMGFNSAFKGLNDTFKQLRHVSVLQLHHHQGAP